MKLAFFFLVFCLTVNLFAQEKVSLIVQSGHSGPVTDVVFSADDRFIITSGEDKRIVIWDRTTQKQFGVLQGHNGPVNALCIVPDDPDHVYSVSDDGLFIKWHILSEKVVSRISIGGTIGAIEYCPVTKKFAIGSKIISLVTENMDSLVNYGGTLATSQYLKVAIEDIAFDKTGSAVICTDGNKRVMNFDLGGEKDAEVLLRHCSHGREVISELHSGISQDDIADARDGDYGDQLALILSAPYAVANRMDLNKVYTLARWKPQLFGEGDVAFYDLARTSVNNINTLDLAYKNERDSSEKGYINSFNHITGQAFVTSCFLRRNGRLYCRCS